LLNLSIRSALLSVTVLAAVLACGSAVAGHFGLRVNDVSGLGEPWPLVGGLPFPEGELHDASQVRIVGADGEEVPAQIDVAARLSRQDIEVSGKAAGLAGVASDEDRIGRRGGDVSRQSLDGLGTDEVQMQIGQPSQTHAFHTLQR
jgi:hypothetical protein